MVTIDTRGHGASDAPDGGDKAVAAMPLANGPRGVDGGQRLLRTRAEDARDVNLSMPIGAKPPPAPDKASADGPSPEPTSPRPTSNATIGANYRFADVLSLHSGSPLLDLLDGASLTGTGGRPRWQSAIDIRDTYASANIGLDGRLQGPTRVP